MLIDKHCKLLVAFQYPLGPSYNENIKTLKSRKCCKNKIEIQETLAKVGQRLL